MKRKTTQKTRVNIIEFENGWSYVFSIKNIISDKQQSDFSHKIISPKGESILIHSNSKKSLEKIAHYLIYNELECVFKSKEWKYFIKTNLSGTEIKLSHFIEYQNQIISFKAQNVLVSEDLINKWSRFNFIKPEIIGTKSLCTSMFTQLDKACKEAGFSPNKQHISEEDLNNLNVVLALKKLLE